jgi:hypothetical protein
MIRNKNNNSYCLNTMVLNQKNEPCAHCGKRRFTTVQPSVDGNVCGFHAGHIRTSFNIALRMTVETITYDFLSNTLLGSGQRRASNHSNVCMSKNDAAKLEEQSSLQWLGKEIGQHCFCGTVLYRHSFLHESVLDKEVTDINVPRLLTSQCSTILLQAHCTLIVLV